MVKRLYGLDSVLNEERSSLERTGLGKERKRKRIMKRKKSIINNRGRCRETEVK